MDQLPEKKGLNLADILLPKKEARTSASAERVNAGVLLDGEQAASLPKKPAPAPIEAPKAPEGPVESSSKIAPLQTYQSDMETVISQKDISAVSIATAEANRSARMPLSAAPKRDWSKYARLSIIISGLVLLLCAAAVLAFVFLRPAPSISVNKGAQAPFIAVDATQVLVVTPQQFTRATLLQNLESVKEKTAISIGLMARTYVVLSTTTVEGGNIPPQADIQSLLSTLAPNISDTLLRTLDPTYYVLGTHVFDGNQPYLILKVDSYEQAFSGMLDWERTMPQELSPLFTRTPAVRLIGTGTDASSTPQAALIPSLFRDKIVANHDARVLLSDQGDILLLWAFIDRTTLVITTNESTLAEIISRRSVYTPAQ